MSILFDCTKKTDKLKKQQSVKISTQHFANQAQDLWVT